MVNTLRDYNSTLGIFSTKNTTVTDAISRRISWDGLVSLFVEHLLSPLLYFPIIFFLSLSGFVFLPIQSDFFHQLFFPFSKRSSTTSLVAISRVVRYITLLLSPVVTLLNYIWLPWNEIDAFDWKRPTSYVTLCAL